MMHKFNSPDSDGFRRISTRIAEFISKAEETMKKSKRRTQPLIAWL
jgi:predicted HAD superfamily phosphohydrolase